MLCKRIIPCLDVKNEQVVKGTNFVNLVYAGSPVELAERYSNEGADELVFLDITASSEKRKTLLPIVKEVARSVRIPFTVGGGISEIKDIEALLGAGADKISLNTSIVKNPKLISEVSKQFGSQAIIAAIDIKITGKFTDYYCYNLKQKLILLPSFPNYVLLFPDIGFALIPILDQMLKNKLR